MPVTLNHGFEMPAWYDLPPMEVLQQMGSRLDLGDVEGLEESVEKFIALGVDSNSCNTVFGGFSQGAAVGLRAGIEAALRSIERNDPKLWPLGIVGISGYLPDAEGLKEIFEKVKKDSEV